MGILHVTKKRVPEVLCKRLLQALKLRDNALLENLDGDLESSFSAGMYVCTCVCVGGGGGGGASGLGLGLLICGSWVRVPPLTDEH